MNKVFISLAVACFWGGRAMPLAAGEALGLPQLAAFCAAYQTSAHSAEGRFCTSYIQGFIDGAVATDARIRSNTVADYQRRESLADRALRTRVPGRDGYPGLSRHADFCLGDPIPLQQVVLTIAGDIAKSDIANSKQTAREFVYQSVQKHYPCSG